MITDALLQGLEDQYFRLEDAYKATLGDEPPAQACLECFLTSRYCPCDKPNLWPIYIVLTRLKNIIQQNSPNFQAGD